MWRGEQEPATRKIEWVRLGVVASEMTESPPDSVPGVVVLYECYLVNTAGRNGQLVAVERDAVDYAIVSLVKRGYSVYRL